MTPFWVTTTDGVVHPMGALTAEAAPKAMMYPEQIAAFEDRFGCPVATVAVDRPDNVVWDRRRR